MLLHVRGRTHGPVKRSGILPDAGQNWHPPSGSMSDTLAPKFREVSFSTASVFSTICSAVGHSLRES